MSIQAVTNAGLMLGLGYVARLVARWRVERRQGIALITPLVDPILIETVFAPHPTEGDDPDLLAEMRDTILHLNRRAYADEFWGLHRQLIVLDDSLGESQKATLRRALLRLLDTDDRWLQIVAAKTAASLEAVAAIEPIERLLNNSQTLAPQANAADQRYVDELKAALSTLTDR